MLVLAVLLFPVILSDQQARYMSFVNSHPPIQLSNPQRNTNPPKLKYYDKSLQQGFCESESCGTMATGFRVLLAGSTGETGKVVLQRLLDDSRIAKVGEPTPSDT